MVGRASGYDGGGSLSKRSFAPFGPVPQGATAHGERIERHNRCTCLLSTSFRLLTFLLLSLYCSELEQFPFSCRIMIMNVDVCWRREVQGDGCYPRNRRIGQDGKGIQTLRAPISNNETLILPLRGLV